MVINQADARAQKKGYMIEIGFCGLAFTYIHLPLFLHTKNNSTSPTPITYMIDDIWKQQNSNFQGNLKKKLLEQQPLNISNYCFLKAKIV